MQHHRLFRLAVTAARLFLGLTFFTAGMGKLMPFPGFIGPVWLEAELAPYGLGLYARFIAYSQLVVGALLLSGRFATLGAVMLMPILLNIFVVTISLQWRGTPYVVAVMLAMNALLLLADWHRLKFLLTDDPASLRALQPIRRRPRTDALWVLGLLAVVLAPVGWSAWPGLGYGLAGVGLVVFGVCGWDSGKVKTGRKYV